MEKARSAIQHNMNALHIYCLLCRLGVSAGLPGKTAVELTRDMAVKWEHTRIYRLIYR